MAAIVGGVIGALTGGIANGDTGSILPGLAKWAGITEVDSNSQVVNVFIGSVMGSLQNIASTWIPQLNAGWNPSCSGSGSASGSGAIPE